MGFIKASTESIVGTFTDQWKDFYGPRPGVAGTAALFQADPSGTNAGRGENTKSSSIVDNNAVTSFIKDNINKNGGNL